jgi:hypothetical protein
MNIPRICDELRLASLGDVRRTKRLSSMGEALSARPGVSLPEAMVTAADLEATYRFLANDAVTAEQLLLPHATATLSRASTFSNVYAVSDSTECRFSGLARREGLGRLTNGGQGFVAHMCLLVADSKRRVPLGIAAMETICRTGPKPKKQKRRKRKDNPRRESLRWWRVVQAVSVPLRARTSVIHVMDREADIYELLSHLTVERERFIVRVSFDRRVVSGKQKQLLSESLREEEVLLEREVPLSKRRGHPKGGNRRQTNPPRQYRLASLSIARKRVSIRRPKGTLLSYPQRIELNVVHVYEKSPPDGEDPVDWKLFTSEPIDTAADVESVVDGYRTRWVIEEFFKALKTGCAYERSQLESYHSLHNLLCVMIPVAWQLLAMRTMAREEPTAAASLVMTATQQEVLKAVATTPLSPEPSAQEVLAAVARLGGHIKNNGPPGWLVLGRGMHALRMYEIGWTAAHREVARCDQS